NTRAFTISSSPSEDFLMITTQKGVTPFKKFMKNLKPGETITTSHPAGTFTLDESERAIFLAGGIGITPFRSIIKYAFDQKLKTSITLIYSNSDEDFLFKEELGFWQKQLPNLKIIYHNSGKLGRLNLDSSAPARASLIYYLAGPPKMVDDFAKMLLDLGVDETNIRYDRFDGY
ncbi:MAG: FAD-dependent oxidoreductase, partial [Candidatus Daviesbacteria bacterium]|nr:FAD-dependent oxidoreductase [Candidatus Daviesbacteria bacterium]